MDSPKKGLEMLGFANVYAVSLNKLLNKQLSFRRFEPMWRSRAVTVML